MLFSICVLVRFTPTPYVQIQSQCQTQTLPQPGYNRPFELADVVVKIDIMYKEFSTCKV